MDDLTTTTTTTSTPAPGASPVTPSRGRRRRLAAAGVTLLLALAVTSLPSVRRGLADPAGREPVTGFTDVEVRDDVWEYFAFTPSVVAVPVGATMTWTSTSGTEHNVVFTVAGQRVASPVFGDGASWSFTFDEPGDVRYACTLHEGMDGRVVVG